MDAIMAAEAQLAEVNERLAVSVAPVLEAMSAQMAMMRPALEAIAEQAQVFSRSIQWAAQLQDMFRIDPLPIAYISPIGIIATSSGNTVQEQPAQKMRATPRASAVIVPANAQWEDIRIEFADERNARIFYKNRLLGEFDWQQLGFARQNTTDFRPDVLWELLFYFAMLAEHKQAIPTVDLIANGLRVDRQALAQRKRLLSVKLRAALGITGDPFHAYSVATGYRAVFSLKAPRGLREDVYLHRSGKPLRDIDGTDDEE